MPKSVLGKWARAWRHTRGGAGRLGWECIYKCCLQSKFHSILTSGLVPGALFSTPPPPTPPRTRRPLSLWGPVSLSLCNPCPDAIYGGTAFPAFVSSLRWAPGSFSKAFPGPFSTARAGGGEAGRRGPQLGPPIVHQGPHPMSPTRARLASSGHTMGQLPNLAFLLFLSKALYRPAQAAPPHPWWGSRSRVFGFQ